MSATARLNLPYIAPLQGQKQYAFNDAMATLDMLVQPVVLSRSNSAPPVEPSEGDGYIIADGATGLWSGHDRELTQWREGAWVFRAAADGWVAVVLDETGLAVFQDGAWTELTDSGEDPAMLGINTTADETNRLAVAAAGSRFTHEGGGHQLTIDKAAAGETASIVFSDGFDGRAELGLAGDDDFHLKVSADGDGWHDALVVAGATGAVALAAGQLGFPASANPSADSHTLDDYEEGTWSPALNLGGGATGMSYASAPAGRYTKIGRMVTAWGSLTLSAKGSSTGAATIAGLPFTSADDGIAAAASVGFASGFSLVSGAVLATLPPNSDRLSLYQSSNGSASALSHSNATNGSQIVFCVSYDV